MVNETISLIMGRRSIRTFKPQQIEEEKLQIILDAAQYAPNGGGRQLWHFTVVQNQAFIEQMVKGMTDIMSSSALARHQQKAADPHYHTFYHAPTVIVVSGDKDAKGIELDCGAATENMIIAAESLGLSSCWIGSAELILAKEEIKKALGIPEGYKPFHAVSLGYNSSRTAVKPAPRKENIVNYVR